MDLNFPGSLTYILAILKGLRMLVRLDIRSYLVWAIAKTVNFYDNLFTMFTTGSCVHNNA